MKKLAPDIRLAALDEDEKLGDFVAVARSAWCKLVESIGKVAQHVGIGVLLNQQRRGGVRHEQREQAGGDSGFRNEAPCLFSHIGEAGPARRDVELAAFLFHVRSRAALLRRSET